MKIVVCVKQVPDIQGERSFGPQATVSRSDDDVLNELDENAVEAALQLVDAHGGEVIALSVGPAPAAGAVRKALQLGAVSGVLVSDERIAGADAIGTATVLAAAVRAIGADAPVDLVVTGMAALDGLTSVVPGALAALLGIPALTLAHDVTIDGTTIRVHRDMGEVAEVLEASLPALITITDQAYEARYPTFPAIMAAKKKEIRSFTLDDLGVAPSVTGGAGSRTRIDAAQARPPRPACEVVQDAGDGGRRLVEFLASRNLA